jgi:hypothetical protein
MTAPMRTVVFLIRSAVAGVPESTTRIDNENDFQ